MLMSGNICLQPWHTGAPPPWRALVVIILAYVWGEVGAGLIAEGGWDGLSSHFPIPCPLWHYAPSRRPELTS